MSKRILLVVIAGSLIFSAAASVRTDSLAVDPWMLDDYDNVLTYPRMLQDYGKVIRYSFVERYDAASSQSLAAGWGMASCGREQGSSYGLIVREPVSFLGGDWNDFVSNGIVNSAIIAPAGLQTPRTPENKARLIVARQMLGRQLALSLGYGVRLADDTLQDDPAGQQIRWNRSLLVSVGLGGRMNSLPLVELDSVEWSLTYYYPYVYTLAKDLTYAGDGSMVFSRYEEGVSEKKLSFDFNLLAIKEDYAGETDLRLTCGLKRHGMKYGETRIIYGLTTDYELDSSLYYLGASLTHDLGEKTLVVAGLKGERSSRAYQAAQSTIAGVAVDKGEEQESVLALPLAIGVENQLKSWLALRLGLSTDLYRSRSWDVKDGLNLNNQAGSGAEIAEESATLATGFGLSFGNLQVDTQIDQVIYFHGPAFRSAPGFEDSERRPVAQLEASYNF